MQLRERLMHFPEVQRPMTHQLAVQQQHRNLVSPARTDGRIRIDIGNVEPVGVALERAPEFLCHPLAQMTAWTGKQQKACRNAQWAVELSRRTECAMNSTVTSGTSPTAVT